MPKEITRKIVSYKDITVDADFNARKSLKGIDELAADIKQNGLIQPLVVREGGPDKDGKRKLKLFAGFRRYHAVGKLGWDQVEVKVVKVNDEEARRINYSENEQRLDLEPIERAEHLQKIMTEFGLTQAQLAKKIGKSEAYVSQTLSVLKNMAPEVKEAVAKKEITPTHAREMATLTKEQQKEILKEAEEKKAKTGKAPTVAELKESIDDKKAKNGKPKRGRKPQEFDREKIQAAKEHYDGVSFDKPTKPKQALLEMLGVLVSRVDNPQLSDEKKPIVKGQIAVLEWALGQRDRL